MILLDDITKALGDSCCMVYAFVFPSELGHTAVVKDFCICNIQTIKKISLIKTEEFYATKQLNHRIDKTVVT